MRALISLVMGVVVSAAVARGADAALVATPAAERAVTVVPKATLKNTLTAKTERVATDRTKLSIVPEAVAPGTPIKLLDNEGKPVSVEVGRDGGVSAIVDPKRSYIVSPAPMGRRALAKDGLSFPARYVTFAESGTPNLGGLFLRPSRVPLIWDDASASYETELLVGYEFQDGAERELATPKTVTFFAEGGNARIVADSVVVARSGGAGYQRVKLFTKDFEHETQFTARAGPTDEVQGSVSVLREPGALRLALPSSEIAAFGVGSGALTISLVARDGSPLPAAQPLEVLLSSQRLRLPASAMIPAGQSATEVQFRSSGYGSDQLHAEAGVLRSLKVIRLVFPVAATIGAVVGGAVGGAARYLRNRRKTPKLYLRRLAEGVLVGVIFVAAAWAGLVTIDLSTGILGTPFGAFVLAALSGYVGCLVLDRVTDRALGSLKKAE